jgi:diguanylate cyclase (GGDEF)-like protein
MNPSPAITSESDQPLQLVSLGALAEAETSRAVASHIVQMARTYPDCIDAFVLWGMAEGERLASEPSGEPVAADLARAVASVAPGAADWSQDGSQVAIPFSHRGDAAVLMLTLGIGAGDFQFLPGWAEPLRVADVLMRRLLSLETLQSSVAGLKRAEQLQGALFAISDLAGSDRDMPELLKGIHAILGTLMYAENFYIVRFDAEMGMLRFLYFVDVEDPAPVDVPLSDRAGTLTWYLLNDGKPLHGSLAELREQVSGPLHYVGTDSNDWMGVPLLRDGVSQGALVLQSYEPGILYSSEDQAVLEFVASHILTALERKQGNEELEQRVQQRTLELAQANRGLQLEVEERQRGERLQVALFHIAQLATADISQAEFYEQLHAEVGKLINTENFFIALVSEDGQALDFPYYIDSTQRSSHSRPMGRGLSEYVLRHGTALLCTHAQIEVLARAGEIDLQVAGPASDCWLGMPLKVGDQAIGLVVVQSYDAAVVYGPAEQELLSFVASQIANTLHRRRAAGSLQQANAQLEQRVQERTQELSHEILERERIQQQLEHEVLHDALTGLPNRGYLRERLDRVLGLLRRHPGRSAALLYLDIDRFKVVNDSLGHLAGDTMLKEVAIRLQSCVRDPDLVARLSGDEFAILLEDVQMPETAIKVAQRMLAKLATPLIVAGKEIEPSASIGIAIADAHYQAADEVLRDADIALYRAKSLGRKRFEMFDASLQKHAVDVLEMERDLRVALQHDQFVPYFQPIQSLQSGETMGYEALIRWNHPQRGLLAPGEFLRIAEDSGSIEAIDWWMFEHSCALAASHLEDRHYLTINVSPLHFRRADFSERLLEMLRRTGLPPGRVVLEVTEGSLLDDPEGVRDILATLRNEGVGAALDDFGTGYSSLSYLHTFPLRIVKIDRSFVARLGVGEGSSDAVVVSILALALALGIEAVAEGIETIAQRDTLLALGCHYGQGYLLGRPAGIEHWKTPTAR